MQHERAILASALWQKCAAMMAAKRVLAGAILMLAVSASGCSTIDFAYSMAPTALGLMADNYLDLDGEQETLLKERLITVREWVRTTQMPEVSKLLNDVRARTAGKVAVEDVVWLTAESRRLWKVTGTRVATEIAEMAPRLTADSLAALKKKFARNNAEYTKDTVDATPRKQRDKRLERVKENAERWYGNFDDAQSERIRSMVDVLPLNPRLLLDDRMRRQNALLAILQGVVDKTLARADAQARLITLFTDFEAGRSPAYQTHAASYLKASQEMTAEIANLASAEQRDTAQRRFKRWADDTANLAARKEP